MMGIKQKKRQRNSKMAEQLRLISSSMYTNIAVHHQMKTILIRVKI